MTKKEVIEEWFRGNAPLMVVYSRDRLYDLYVEWLLENFVYDKISETFTRVEGKI